MGQRLKGSECVASPAGRDRQHAVARYPAPQRISDFQKLCLTAG